MARWIRLPSLAIRALTALLGRSLSPEVCAACDGEVAGQSVFCAPCAATIVRAHGVGVPELVAFAEFGGAVARALRRMKYAGRPDLARPLGDLLRHAVRDAVLHGDVVVPVPLHPRRLAERGYNQAALLARPLAVELGARFAPRALARTRNTPRQATLQREARLQNVAHAFEARTHTAVRGRRVVLVDDVATTGSTLAACRAALADAGATSVTAVVVAWAPGSQVAPTVGA